MFVSRKSTIVKRFVPAVAAAAVLLAVFWAAPLRAGEFSVSGKIVNGTSPSNSVDIGVSVIDPAGGMKKVREVQCVDGLFTVENLDDGVSLYLVSVDYKGVPYYRHVKPDGTNTVFVEITVFENTTSWDDVTVSLPRFSATRHGDHLVVERVFEIVNNADPPVVITGEEGNFRIFLPEDAQSLNGPYVETAGVPIRRKIASAGEKNVYRVDFPIHPGLTRVGLSYNVSYSDARYQHTETILYELERYSVFAGDPDMKVTSTSNSLVPHGDADLASHYDVEGLSPGNDVVIQFAGGESAAGAAGAAEEPRIFVAADRTESSSMTAMIAMFAVLMVMMVVVLKNPRSTPEKRSSQLVRQRDLLTRRIARLDDLAAAGAVSPAVCKARRAEFKAQLVSIVHDLGPDS